MIRSVFSAIRNRKRKERSKPYLYATRALRAIGLAYILLLIFPQPLFAYSVRVGQVRFYSDRPLPLEIKFVVEQATAKLSGSSLYTRTESFDVYIATD